MFVHQENDFTVMANELEVGKEALVTLKNTGENIGCKISKVIREQGNPDYRAKVNRILNFADRSPYDYCCEFDLGNKGNVFVGVTKPKDQEDIKFPYEAVIGVPKAEVERIMKYLNEEPQDESECLNEDRTITYTATFGNGYQMDVKVCGVQYEPGGCNTAWSEAVLFTPDGHELACTDVCDDFLGDWELTYNGIMYRAKVVMT